MSFTLHYHPAVRIEDFPLIDRRTKVRIRKAIEERLQTAPHDYGDPLRKTLKGYWKLRVGDSRVAFKVIESEVWILGIRHRKALYYGCWRKDVKDSVVSSKGFYLTYPS
jgi:mRNA interferase RelE/StbE